MNNLFSSLLFIIWPFAGFISSLKKFKSFWGGILFVAFGVFIAMNTELRPREDMSRHIASADSFDSLNKGILSVEGELYKLWTVKLIHAFDLTNTHLYILWAIVFFSLFYLCLRLLVSLNNSQTKFGICILITAILLITPVEFLGLRFFTGAWLYIYSAAKVELSGNYKYGLFMLLCPFFHFMFWPLVIVYALFKFIHVKTKILFIVLIVTWCLSFFNYSSIVRSLWGEMSGSMYLTDSRNAGMVAEYNYGRYLYLPLQLCFYYSLYVQYKKEKYLDPLAQNLLRLAMFGFIVLNLVAISWDFTLRFRNIAFWFAALSTAYYYKQYRNPVFANYFFVLPIALFFYRYDFFFISGPEVINYFNIFFSGLLHAWEYCNTQVLKF